MRREDVFRDGILADRVALVTGGGTGIGSEVALELARAGAHVVVASRDPAHLEPTRAGVEALGRRCWAVALDVRDAEAVEQLFRRLPELTGGLDVLVNNAAGNFLCRAQDLSPNGFRSVVEIDLIGSFQCARFAYPLLRERGGGVVLQISATLSYQGVPLQVHAGSAKAGVDAMTRHLATEWGPDGIRVVGIAPGPIADTEGMRRLAPGLEDQIAQQVPLRRLGRRVDVARVAVFLASDAAAWVTGTTWIVDGGQRLKAAPWNE